MIITKEDTEISALKAEALVLKQELQELEKQSLVKAYYKAHRLAMVQERLVELIDGQLRVYIQASNRFIQTLNGVPVP